MSPEPVFRVCIVCMGNICRSPIAEVVLRQRLQEAGLGHRVTVDSAGTGGWHVGGQADLRARAILRRHGFDGEAHRARQFSADWFAELDLVLAADHDNADHLMTLASDSDRSKVRLFRGYDPAAVASGDVEIPDPYYSDDAAFGDVLALVDDASTWVIEAIRAELTRRDETGGEHSRR